MCALYIVVVIILLPFMLIGDLEKNTCKSSGPSQVTAIPNVRIPRLSS